MDSRVEELTKSIIARHLGLRREQIKLTHRLRGDYGCDNLTLIGMGLDLEDVERTEFPFALLEHVDTVSDLVDVVNEVVEGRAAARRHYQALHEQKLTA
ncbi:MAG TPA: acyl carrier protein [Polyangiaceae bacterium]|nr:acyl carrier protein [Polyangiaceae bacterium]